MLLCGSALCSVLSLIICLTSCKRFRLNLAVWVFFIIFSWLCMQHGPQALVETLNFEHWTQVSVPGLLLLKDF
jgi:hypothetical protein